MCLTELKISLVKCKIHEEISSVLGNYPNLNLAVAL